MDCSGMSVALIVFLSLFVCLGYCNSELSSSARFTSFLYCPAVDFHHLFDQVESVSGAFSVPFFEKVRLFGSGYADTVILVE